MLLWSSLIDFIISQLNSYLPALWSLSSKQLRREKREEQYNVKFANETASVETHKHLHSYTQFSVLNATILYSSE